jgi:hypothetical protein
VRFLLVVCALVLWTPAIGIAAETPHLVFVSEYVRELGANEDMRARGEKDVAEADQFAGMIRSSTRIIFELTAQANIMKGMTLNKPFDALPTSIAAFYEQKIQVHRQFIEMASAFVAGPKPDVDYGSMAADAPKLEATLEYIDRALFNATPLVFATLIADKPDKEGHMSRLRITRVERDKLVRSLQISFGDKMERKDQDYIVSSATVLRDYLSKKGYKCSDEPQ